MGTRISRVVLIGLRRSGKTTVGGLVATKATWTLVDTDAVVESSTGMSPAALIRDHGIDAFRQAERAAVAYAAHLSDAVIATGGGVPLSDVNRALLRRDALVVYLRADPWVLAGRASADRLPGSRPLIDAATRFEEPFVQFAARDPAYRDYCDVIVDAARPPDAVAATVFEWLLRQRRQTGD